MHNLNVLLIKILDIYQNIVQIYNNKNVQLFSKNLVVLSLKASWCVKKSEKYFLVLKIAISGLKNTFLFIIFSISHLMIDIDQI